ncbi:RssA Predicted esterase of the alpha-beta hydrolase superfamily [Acidimicrobiia bacterium]
MTKALVLGGGGVAGVAWELGVLDSLFAAGVDLTDADLVVGTSAGSVVAAQICSGEALSALCDRQSDSGSELKAPGNFADLIDAFVGALAGNPEEDERNRRIGKIALSATTVDESARRDVILSRLPSTQWPARNLVITAVDVETGEFVTFDQASGVELVDAIGASCAVPGVWPPVTIGDRRFMDGGVRSIANSDLADGYDVIVVLAPLTGTLGRPFAAEIDALRVSGSVVEVVEGDATSLTAFGADPLDPATRIPALAEGRRQGAAFVTRLAEIWR